MKEFKDGLNTAVFTTIYVVKEKKEITYVTHEMEDGAWQFFSNDDFDKFEDVAMIVSLGELIQIDRSVLDIAQLPLGYIATRQSVNDKWKFFKKEEEN